MEGRGHGWSGEEEGRSGVKKAYMAGTLCYVVGAEISEMLQTIETLSSRYKIGPGVG